MNEHHRFDLAMPVAAIDQVLCGIHAPVVLVEYGDFECPSWRQAGPAVKHVLNRFAGRVGFVFRHFPLEEVHPHALHAALASETADAQGRFWPMHDLLFQNQQHLKLRHLRSYAEKLELDLERYDSEMSDELYLQRVREQIDGGRKSGVRATPTFFINGRIADISSGLTALTRGVEDALRT